MVFRTGRIDRCRATICNARNATVSLGEYICWCVYVCMCAWFGMESAVAIDENFNEIINLAIYEAIIIIISNLRISYTWTIFLCFVLILICIWFSVQQKMIIVCHVVISILNFIDFVRFDLNIIRSQTHNLEDVEIIERRWKEKNIASIRWNVIALGHWPLKNRIGQTKCLNDLRVARRSRWYDVYDLVSFLQFVMQLFRLCPWNVDSWVRSENRSNIRRYQANRLADNCLEKGRKKKQKQNKELNLI